MAEQLIRSKEVLLKEVFEEINKLERGQKWLENFNVLLKALSIRDSYTEGHSRRVAIYSYLIGKELGLDREKLSKIYIGAFLHDIGKIGIPDAILLKPTPLTSTERKLVERHPILGYELLKEYDFPFILNIVLKHHERLDGKGYPLGIDYRKIPFTVSIVSVADVFDALTTDRPYRKALSLEETLSIIGRDSGKAFYPEVVEAGIKVIKRVGVLDIFRGSLLTEDLERFRKEAFFTDVVTGLPTFGRWKEKFTVTYKGTDIAYVAFDIKGLLLINLARGWEKGDEILGDIGHELQKNRIGNFCRFTGGTFLGIVSKKDLSKFREVLNTISVKHRITIHEVTLERKSVRSVEELVAILIKKLKEKKELSVKGGLEKLVRRRWR
ncbi:HD-GYP domain-containing protein [Desulfurobacterium crinifex]